MSIPHGVYLPANPHTNPNYADPTFDRDERMAVKLAKIDPDRLARLADKMTSSGDIREIEYYLQLDERAAAQERDAQ